MAAGTAHVAFNLTGKAISAIGASSAKSKIFKDPLTFNTLYNGVYRAIANIHLAIVRILQDRKNIQFSYVTIEHAETTY